MHQYLHFTFVCATEQKQFRQVGYKKMKTRLIKPKVKVGHPMLRSKREERCSPQTYNLLVSERRFLVESIGPIQCVWTLENWNTTEKMNFTRKGLFSFLFFSFFFLPLASGVLLRESSSMAQWRLTGYNFSSHDPYVGLETNKRASVNLCQKYKYFHLPALQGCSVNVSYPLKKHSPIPHPPPPLPPHRILVHHGAAILFRSLPMKSR